MGCSPKRFSRPPRCDRFDTPPCPSIISVFYAPVNRLIRARLRFVFRRAFSPTLFVFYRRYAPRCFRSRFTACLAFPLFSALFYRRRYAATLLLAFCRLPRLSPIPRLLFIAAMCRGAFARVLPLALPFPYFLPSFIVADMPQRFCSSFTFCSAFPPPFSLFIAAICQGAFVRTSICAAFTCRIFPRPQARGRVLLSAH